MQPSGGGVWRLRIPAGGRGSYRLAQLDDYSSKPRKRFPWSPPVTLALDARVSDAAIPGTWGFGWWNDPFALSFGFGGGERRFPSLPETAWFFFASPPNYLSFRNDLPAQGFLSAVMRPAFSLSLINVFAGAFLPLAAWRLTAPLARRLARRFLHEDSGRVKTDVTRWHHYEICWEMEQVQFSLDERQVFTTKCVPRAPLGLVIWIDNQFAGFPPGGKLTYGLLPNAKAAWLDIRDVRLMAV